MKKRIVLGAIVVVAVAVAAAWVFYVPILEAPDETVHFEYSTAIYAAGGLLPPRDAARTSIPAGRAVPDPAYLEDASAVAVIAEKPDVKAPAHYGSATYYGGVDSGAHAVQRPAALLDPPLLRYYPYGYYLLDAAVMGIASLFTSSPVALFFAARLLSTALLVPSLLLTFAVLRRLGCSPQLSLVLTGVAGLLPMSSMMASSVQSDNLSFTLVMLALLAALEVRRSPHSMWWLAVLGAALGGLLVTKVHYFLVVAAAVGAMILTQRLDRRNWHRWPRELAVLVAPIVLLEAVQVWFQWSAPPLISTGQLGDLPDYRAAIAGGPLSIATYAGRTLGFSFLDHTFGREFGSFWGVFGWVDTPLVLGSPGITFAVWGFIAGLSILLFGCTVVRFGQVTWRLVRIARRGH
ncbi:MAG TPA: DUF2142 domain-containing protein, partial [Candidatus Dormibacteraeota bacterium]|nr:DUF2142 domain-containing protein [Candidatus Dormibacteraeota bacterium]